METKHTPGPWQNNKWNSQEHQISALGGTVAKVSHSHTLISETEADANANLIAAAPDLYLAAKLAAENIRDGYQTDACVIVETLEAAIQKAEGLESPPPLPPVDILETLRQAEGFLAGFEDCQEEEDRPACLPDVRRAIQQLSR